MYASVGDRLVIKGQNLGEPIRDGQIIGAEHADGSPPYSVRWDDTGRESLIFPGPDAAIHHFEHHASSEPRSAT